MWQDIVLTVGGIIFAVALVPSVFSKNKPSLWTSLSTALVLYVFVFVYFSLSLWFSAVTTFITASFWLTLYIQKLILKAQKATQ